VARYRPVDTAQSFPELETRVLERWRERDVFHESIRRREGAEPFIFYEGPPTANGRPGSHHVLARVFKDVFPRYQTMRGRFAPRKAGWDCHGLPVELEVEKELGFTSKDDIERYGVAEFNAKCRESVLRYIDEWNELTERIGFWIDTDAAYYTLTNEYVESVWWSLKQVWEKGLLTEGHKVVPYCPRCGTALSSHEVALGYKDIVDPSVYVKFPLRSAPSTSFLGWTTTPWTLLSNAALAVHPDVTYAYTRVGDEVLVLAEPLVERVLGEGADIIDRVRGADLEGTEYEPPFPYITDYGPRGHTVLPADFVTTEDGTGIVHTAIAFGEDDFRLGEQYGIKVQNPVRPDGTFDERIEEFAGRGVREAAQDIIASLERRGRLFRAEDYEHSYPHCWRCGTPLIYYAKKNWYVRTTEVRDELLAANETIDWHPPHIKHGRFGKWLENNVDWALSRERYWGTPLPVWRCGEGHVVCVGSLAEIAERGGHPPEDLHRPYIDEVVLECEECGGEMHRVPDLIDVWWDSGCMPFAQWHAPFENEETFRERFPADYICEGLDQTRGWFYSLLAVSVLLFGGASYRTCVCLGLILDPEGQKMSKSKGNVVVPWDVLSEHGADAFRWYYFTSKQPWDGYRFSLETVGESVRQFLKPLWNTYAFYVQYANLAADVSDTGSETDLDRWIRSRLAATTERVVERMEDYDTTFAGRAIAEFVDDLSNWYVRLSRRRFWRGDDPAAFHALRDCLLGVSKLLAPLTPFVTDEIYDNLDGSEPSVHLCDFPQPGERDEELEWRMQVVRDAVELGRAARGAAKMKVRQPLREAVVVAADREREAIEELDQLLKDELNVKSVRYVSEADELGSFELKPNYRTLGPRFGKQMPQIAAAIAALDPARLRAGERAGVNVDGHDHEIGPEDVTMALQPLDGYQVERSGTHAVALNLELDDELRREGLAREVVHAVQAARKNAGLDVEDRIALTLAGDKELLAAAREHEDYVTGETLATSLAFDGAHTEAERAEIEGRELSISVRLAPA
jgi:isoleucyl-tRNA synthetase